MDSTIGTSFTHAECLNCGHTAKIETFGSFEMKMNKNEDSKLIQMTQVIVICPICQDDHCVGLFPSDLN